MKRHYTRDAYHRMILTRAALFFVALLLVSVTEPPDPCAYRFVVRIVGCK